MNTNENTGTNVAPNSPSSLTPLTTYSVHPLATGPLDSLRFSVAGVLTMVLPIILAGIISQSMTTWAALVAVGIVFLLTAMAARVVSEVSEIARGTAHKSDGQGETLIPRPWTT